MSEQDESPYPKSPAEAWLDRWFPRVIWVAIGIVIVLVLTRGWTP